MTDAAMYESRRRKFTDAFMSSSLVYLSHCDMPGMGATPIQSKISESLSYFDQSDRGREQRPEKVNR